jgi:hypothetical protein
VTDWPATIAICAATLLGPVFAVLVTRWNDDRKAKRERRMMIFRALMGTRRLPLSNDHVAAINLIEVEFHHSKEIMQAWKDVTNHLITNPEPIQQWGDRLESLKATLLSKIAKELAFDVTNLDLRGGYAPVAWGKNERRLDHLWAWFYDLANHRNSLPVTAIERADLARHQSESAGQTALSLLHENAEQFKDGDKS